MMRIRIATMVVLLLALVFSPACLELSSTNNGGTGGTGAASACYTMSTSCDQCRVCAGKEATGQCHKEYEACRSDPSCASADDCVNTCPKGNTTCLDLCFAMAMDANTTFTDYYTCMYCGACPEICPASALCGG